MKYAVLVLESQADFAERTDPARLGAYWGAYSAYGQALGQAGVAAGGNCLHPSATATTVRIRDGKRTVQDGPFADTKEQIGGLFVIDVPNLDAAIEWAARCPSASRAGVEIRPIVEMPTQK